MKRFWFNCSMVTIFTFALMGGLYEVLQLKMFSAFDPIGQAIGDMEISDIAFAIRKEPPPDEKVVLVNIGYLSRAEIAEEIRQVIKYKPKVIGFDILFSDQGTDSLANISLGDAIKQAQSMGIKVVMAEKLWQSERLVREKGDTEEQDSIEHTIPEILQNSYEGYVNLDTDAEHQEDLKACRNVNPKVKVKDKYEVALEVMMAMCADSAKAKKFLDRNRYNEVINYRGNVVDIHKASDSTYRGKYAMLDPEQALDTGYYAETESLIKDKIIVFGFLGEDMFDTSWDDKFFTPINVNYAGKTRPDMWGAVVHANVISMILNEDYVDTMPLWAQVMIAITVLMLTVALFFKIEEKLPIWYDLLSLVIQVVLVILISFIMIMAFSRFSLKLDFTLTLAAAALVGTCFELYNGGVLRLYHVITSRFTKPKDDVLTPD